MTDNVAQVVSGLRENVKTNQQRIHQIESVLYPMSRKIDKLNTLLVDNGYAKAVKESAAEIRALREDFSDFRIGRAATCPTRIYLAKKDEEDDKRRSWGATIFRLIAAGVGLVSTIILIYEKILL